MWREKKWHGSWPKDVGCSDMAFDLAGAVDGSSELSRSQRRHADHCLRCQAELVQHRKLARALRGLRTELLQPSPAYMMDVITSLEDAPGPEPARPLLSGRRIAYAASGLAAATAAGAVSAVVLTARSRRTRLAS